MILPTLVGRQPQVSGAELIAGLVPPPLFDDARFATYQPDPAHPSQQGALAAAERLAAGLLAGTPRRTPGRSGLLRRTKPPAAAPSGLYLDGGFGVGKTHLLAALWHAAPAPKSYSTFVELTSVTGVLGMAATVEALAGHRLLAVDEFELDDPGDTVLMSTLLGRLAERGVCLAATSNTQPEDLGEGRFAADDFRREIQGLARRFTVVRVDGPDYRRRSLAAAKPPLHPAQLRALAAAEPNATYDDFLGLLTHLAGLHPSRYGRLIAGVSLVTLAAVTPVGDEAMALRLVVLVDRLYDRGIPVAYSGSFLAHLFPPALLAGPHRKKYQRALSRLTALTGFTAL